MSAFKKSKILKNLRKPKIMLAYCLTCGILLVEQNAQERERKMNLFIWRAGFKIKSKADAEKFLNAHNESDFGHAESDIHWCDGEYDYWLEPKEKRVVVRSVEERGNIFALCFECVDPVETIYRTRKYINSQVFA